MIKEKNAINDKCIVGRNYVIGSPELIKIRTIKKKHADQIPELPLSYDSNPSEMPLRFLGQYASTWAVAIHAETERLIKIRMTDYVSVMLHDQTWAPEKSWAVFEKVPQLFTE